MSSDKNGKEKKLGGKVAGLAVAAGFFWGIFRFIKGRKEEESLIREYYGDREDFHLPSDSEQKYDDDDEDNSDNDKVLSHDDDDKEVEIDPAVEELKTDIKEEVEVIDKSVLPELKREVEEKPWFLSLFDPPKSKENTPVLKEKENEKEKEKDDKERERETIAPKKLQKIENYEIKKGDTLWAISRKYGVSLEKLKAVNGLDADHIYAGETLIVPED